MSSTIGPIGTVASPTNSKATSPESASWNVAVLPLTAIFSLASTPPPNGCSILNTSVSADAIIEGIEFPTA